MTIETIDTTIDTLKKEEKLTVENQSKSDCARERRLTFSIGLMPKQPWVGYLLVAIGLLGLSVQAGVLDAQVWNYWWLIFFVLPYGKQRAFGCFSRTRAQSETFSAETNLKN